MRSSDVGRALCCVAVDKDFQPGQPVFNRAVSLKDAWAKEQKKK
jgi:hypothetical protein